MHVSIMLLSCNMLVFCDNAESEYESIGKPFALLQESRRVVCRTCFRQAFLDRRALAISSDRTCARCSPLTEKATLSAAAAEHRHRR